MRRYLIAGFGVMVLGMCGCARSLPPHEGLDQAFKKSFNASGMNYSSKSRITDLTVPKEEAPDVSSGKPKMSLAAGLEIVRGLSINADGAVDMKAKKSEVLYELRYDRDNVEVAVKLPMFMDYDTQTIYVGPSVINTILETFYPQAPSLKGKLLRINVRELIQENAESSPEIAKLLGENRFSAKNIDLWNGAIKNGTFKALSKINDANISDQPLTELDKKEGIARRIQVKLNHDDSVSVVLDLVEGIAQGLLQDGLISEKEYDVLHTLTDRQSLEGITSQFALALTFDVGITPAGVIGLIESTLKLADKGGVYQLGINNVTVLRNYEMPRFTMTPETSNVVDVKDLLGIILTDTADQTEETQSDDDGTEEPVVGNDPILGDS
jgi:hypothetical protein